MEPLSARLRARLVANHHVQRTLGRFDHLVDLRPLLHLLVQPAHAFWLISELDPDDEDLFFGLCAPPHLSPYLGYGRLSDVAAWAHCQGFTLERDTYGVAAAPLSIHLANAQAAYRMRCA